MVKKRGRTGKDCERKCRENGFTAKNIIKQVGVENTRIGQKGDGNKVIQPVDKVRAVSPAWRSFQLRALP
jgi:hypothetical protein